MNSSCITFVCWYVQNQSFTALFEFGAVIIQYYCSIKSCLGLWMNPRPLSSSSHLYFFDKSSDMSLQVKEAGRSMERVRLKERKISDLLYSLLLSIFQHWCEWKTNWIHKITSFLYYLHCESMMSEYQMLFVSRPLYSIIQMKSLNLSCTTADTMSSHRYQHWWNCRGSSQDGHPRRLSEVKLEVTCSDPEGLMEERRKWQVVVKLHMSEAIRVKNTLSGSPHIFQKATEMIVLL